MREVLFRGKCIDETCLKGKWLEGDILHDGVTGKYYINTGNCLNESDIVGEEGLLRFVAYEVDPETVCQYTGLTDKNGRKIFENDICSDGTNIVRILWNDSHHQWGVEISKTEYILTRGLIFPLWQYDNCEMNGYRELEIIGNIFDNPELLKE